MNFTPDIPKFNNKYEGGPQDLYKLQVLTKWYQALTSIEEYNNKIYKGSRPSTASMRSSVSGLFMAIFAMLQRNLEPEDLQELYSAVNSTNPEKVRKAYYYMTGFLDKIRFIKIDRKKVYDETDAAAEDEIKTQGDDDPDEEFE